MRRGVTFFALFLSIALLLPLSLVSCSGNKKYEFSFVALDTIIDVSIESGSDEENQSRAKDTKKLVSDYERIFSRTDPDSELYTVNHTDGETVLSGELLEVVRYGLDIAEKTGGAFDITCGALSELWKISDTEAPLPDEGAVEAALSRCGYGRVSLNGNVLKKENGVIIDLGGIAKGYITEKLIEMYRSENVGYGTVSLGGNVGVFGEKPNGENFLVGIRSPYSGKQGDSIGYVEISPGYVSVCGTYERYKTVEGKKYHHVFDPKTGYPADNGIVSAVVISDDATYADAVSTALLVMGNGAAGYARDNGIACIIFRDNGDTVTVGDVGYTRL